MARHEPGAPAASTADHAEFEALAGPFSDVEAVSDACIGCHNVARAQVARTVHWRWERDHPGPVGKRHIAGGLFGALAPNHRGCSACHVGFEDSELGLNHDAPGPVDCLVCHDTTGEYANERFHRPGAVCAACHDERVERERGKKRKRADLGAIARAVGPTSRVTCGSCHFYADGGDGVKHGDLDSSLVSPPRMVDVHMSPDGQDFTCTTCHATREHALAGSRYSLSIDDARGVSAIGGSRGTCQSCHESAAIHRPLLHRHTRRIACQTCHIPAYARGGVATRSRWDWSSAGERGRKGRVITRKDEEGRVVYTTGKGSFEWAEDVTPTYVWFDGRVSFAVAGEAVDGDEPVALNTFHGGAGEPGARIYPVKVMRTRQPFDAGARRVGAFKLTGRERGAYWTSYRWGDSLEAGARALGEAFSGEPGFVETTTTMPITHMVAPAADALACADCHTREGGRLAAVAGVYVPGRDRSVTLDRIGIWLACASMGGVALHGSGRVIAALLRRRKGREA